MSDAEQGTQPQDQSTAPWSSDLEQRFTDPEVRQQVDAYLREVQQPRMTQLEQQVAQTRDAQQLWSALTDSPNETLEAMIDQMYDPETAAAVHSALSGEMGQAAQVAAQETVQQDAQQQVTQEPAQPTSALTPAQQDLLNRFEQQEAEKQYWEELNGLLGREDNKDLDKDRATRHVHSFVHAADGDMEEGLARYRAFVQEFGQPATDEEIANATDPNAAPPVHDGTGAPTNGAPVEQKLTWDEAFASFEQDVKANNQRPAPPVGLT